MGTAVTARQADPAAGTDDLGRKVAFLSRNDAYPEPTTAVELVETHMSWVFLTDRHAYKLKKPVRYPFLDFSTIDARRRDCAEEVRLNRRLAPDVYLGMVPLTEDGAGRLVLAGDGRVVDWLVRMRRLPDDVRLDRVIAERRLTEPDARAIATRLAAFYGALPREEIDPDAYRHAFLAEIAATKTALRRPRYGQDPAACERLASALSAYLARDGAMLARRAADGHIVEGHGDLRPEHVYLYGGIVVTDCLEFDRALRTIDPVDELGYLALECERLGAPQARAWLLETYAALTHDDTPPGLVAFYMGFRAHLRARIALGHLDEQDVVDPQRWIDRAAEYLDVGLRHIGSFG